MRSANDILLLDTHIWIWLLNGDRSIESVRTPIEDAIDGGSLLLSAISIWEVGMLEAKRRIELNEPCLTWVQKGVKSSRVTLAPLSPEIAVLSSRLPGAFRGDPADCIIAATAILSKATLVTKDPALLEYA